jgi:hypothetical protein
MDLGLNDLIDGKRILQIDADSLPTPPQSRYPGEHLYVNCHYDVGMATMPLADLYDVARSDALEIVRRLAANPAVRGFVSVVVRVQGHFPFPELKRPARRRIYEVSILTSKLPASSVSLTSESLGKIEAVESSQLDDIAELFHQAANN